MKRLSFATVAVCAVALLVGLTVLAFRGLDHSDVGGSRGSETLPTFPLVSPAENGLPPELEDFYGQVLPWHACGQNYCSTLKVPLDYSHADDRTVDLAIEMTLAEGTRVGTLVVNPGGPGVPGTGMVREEDAFSPAVRDGFDVVGFDPRGTGGSQPLDCVTDRELDGYVAGGSPPETRAEIQTVLRSKRRFWAGCVARSGDLGAHVSTVDVARDLDILRAALGEETLNYLGFSYGTKLGATYAELFPDRVGRFVLDGAIDPSLGTVWSLVSEAAGFQLALKSYVRHCVERHGCFLGNSVSAGLATITELLHEIETSPLPTNGNRELTAGLAFYGLIYPLYSPAFWPALDAALADALDGSGGGLLAMSDAYTTRGDHGRYGNNSMEAFDVINCLDNPWSVPAAKVPDFYWLFRQASPTFGRFFAWNLIDCRGTPFSSGRHESIAIDADGAGDILVIGTTRDPATPLDEAIALADELESGVLVTYDGDGHTAYNRGSECVDDLVDSYLIDGVVPEDGTAC